jgi:hypothetical protein
MSLVRPLPKEARWVVVFGVSVVALSCIAAGLLASPWPFLAIVAFIVFSFARGERCPQCKHRLKERRVPIDGGPAYRLYWECPRCVALWDAERTIDPSDV